MATPEPQLDRYQQRQRARFERMSLAVRAMPGGRSLLVSLPLGPDPLDSVQGPLAVQRVVFSTVGPNLIKCLRPRALFGLPLLDVRRCADAQAIESTIRQAWRSRTQELRETARVLKALGIDVAAAEGGSVLEFPISGDGSDAKIRMQRVGEAILPSAGPLGGFPLTSISDRVLEVSGNLESSADLECVLDTRIQELRQRARIRDDAARTRGRHAKRLTSVIPTATAEHHRPKVLLVGSKLVEDAALREELTKNGYRAATARSETEALVRLASMTPDLVISQYALGRSDGATLVQATRAVPGIEKIPVVLLDDKPHAARQEAARAVGAAGYLVNPEEPARFVARLRAVVEKPGDRRYTRYPRHLIALLEGSTRPCVATQVGRGGIFIATEDEIAAHSAMHGRIKLPELGRALRFGGEVIYRSESQGTHRRGLGLRFDDLTSEDEAALIEYLAWLESAG